MKKNAKLIDKLVVTSRAGYDFIPYDAIVRTEASGNYTILYQLDKKQNVTSKSIGTFEKQLEDAPFVRVHRSHIVNLKYVRQYVNHDGGYIVMEDGSRIPVSRRKKKDLFEQLNMV